MVVYRDGETHSYHALEDTPPDAFAAMAADSRQVVDRYVRAAQFIRNGEGDTH